MDAFLIQIAINNHLKDLKLINTFWRVIYNLMIQLFIICLLYTSDAADE